jgi:hypothetical protein
MAFLENIKMTGSLGELSFYTMRGVDKTVVRRKGGAPKEYVKNSPTFAVPRRYMSEFGGCSKMGKEVRLMMSPVRELADYNFSGFVNKALKIVQKQDATSELGRRAITLSRHPGLLTGFQLNKYTTFDSVVRTPLTYTLDRATLSARVNIPTLLRDINFHPNNKHTRFRIELSLGIVPDFTFDSADGKYKPQAWYTNVFAPKTVSSPWYPALKGSPASMLEINLTDQVPANESYSLMLSVGVRYGAPMEDDVVQEVKRAGAAKVLGVAGSVEGATPEEKKPVEIIQAEEATKEEARVTRTMQPARACRFAWQYVAPVNLVDTAQAAENAVQDEVSISVPEKIIKSEEVVPVGAMSTGGYYPEEVILPDVKSMESASPERVKHNSPGPSDSGGLGT